MQCPLLATHGFIWPGRDESFACYYHMLQASYISQSMGFVIIVRRIDDPGLRCQQQVEEVECEECLGDRDEFICRVACDRKPKLE